MSIKLAFRNVLKSFQNYVIYFVTLIIAICLFFTFNTFIAQGLLPESDLPSIMKSAGTAMNILMVFVALVLGFLICYANVFMVKKRSKEMATYMLLGMSKRKMSLILAIEVIFVGLIALLIGIVLGIVVSQFLMTYVSKLLAGSTTYQFVFSTHALLSTITSFVMVFVVVIIVSLVAVNKLKLIDLIQADKKVDKAPISNVYIASLLCLISIVGFGITYYLGVQNLIVHMASVLIIGGVSTILFFLSLSGFIVALSSRWKGSYYKNLNMYSIRQINANVASNFLSMSMVCLMVLVAMMSLSVGFSVNKMISDDIDSIPIGGDARYTISYPVNLDKSDDRIEISKLQEQFIAEITVSSYIRDHIEVTTYTVENEELFQTFVSLKDLNRWRVYKGQDEIKLMQGELVFVPLTSNIENEEGILETQVGIDLSKGQFNFLGKDYQVSTQELNNMRELDLRSSGEGYYVIDVENLNEIFSNDVVKYDVLSSNSNITLNFNSVEDDKAFTSWAKKLFESKYQKKYCEIFPESIDCEDMVDIPRNTTIYSFFYQSISHSEIEANVLGNKLIYTFMGLYVGIIFIVSSAVVLAIQLISHATSQKSQYEILSKIGASKSQINKTVFIQCATYFLIPLILAIIHSVFGLKSFATLFKAESFSSEDLFFRSSIPMGIILIVIYMIYLTMTYMAYKKIIHKKQ